LRLHCGKEVFLMLVTGSRLCEAGGMPQRIMIGSRPSSSSVLPITGAG
jgi:hypothetical protein